MWSLIKLVKDFSKSEKKLRKIISSSKSFTFEGEAFVPELVTKPAIEGGGGETKTDVYIKARKISALLKIKLRKNVRQQFMVKIGYR